MKFSIYIIISLRVFSVVKFPQNLNIFIFCYATTSIFTEYLCYSVEVTFRTKHRNQYTIGCQLNGYNHCFEIDFFFAPNNIFARFFSLLCCCSIFFFASFYSFVRLKTEQTKSWSEKFPRERLISPIKHAFSICLLLTWLHGFFRRFILFIEYACFWLVCVFQLDLS